MTPPLLTPQLSESQIKRQYHNTVKVQQKQYKLLQKQMIATVPKERHREVLRQTKEEQMRKIAMLALQYERTIADMAQKQTVCLCVCVSVCVQQLHSTAIIILL